MSPVLEPLNAALPDLFRVIDLIGVLLNGILGGRLARIKRFDAVGFSVLAVISALGGGMVRDVLLQMGPPVALTDPWYLATALVGAGIAMLWKLDSRPWRVTLVIADGTVLGCWAATGALKTLSAGFGIMPALLLGIMTAVGGGMIRDVAAGNVPQVFGGNNLYATPALVSAAIMVAFSQVGLDMVGMLAATVVGSGFTVVAHRRRWQLPQNPEWTLSLTSSQMRQLLAERGPGWTVRRRDVAAHDGQVRSRGTGSEGRRKGADEGGPTEPAHTLNPPQDPGPFGGRGRS
ncbi:MAG: trimeric intracellular cation channel family protein [Pauljensenia sp.]